MENLREVPGTDGKYLIDISTKEGRCISLYNKYGLREKPHYLSTKPDKKGYIYWRMKINGVQVVHQAARWIAITYPELVQNEYFEGAEIDHIDTDRLNNHPSNLRWTDRSGQMRNPLTKTHNSAAHKGKHLPEETRKKLSVAHKGHIVTEETREKISKSKKGISPSAETKKKISLALIGKKGHPGSQKQKEAVIQMNKTSKSKPIYQIDTKTGEIVKKYDSLAEATIAMEIELRKKVYDSNISAAAIGKHKTSCGYIWKYKEKRAG